jgi:hypothetical protein
VLNLYKELPKDDLVKIEACRSFDGFYVNIYIYIYIILTYSVFVGITY